jgi:hypothetical protein
MAQNVWVETLWIGNKECKMFYCRIAGQTISANTQEELGKKVEEYNAYKTKRAGTVPPQGRDERRSD